MMELKGKIARALRECNDLAAQGGARDGAPYSELADAILAIPEIRDALGNQKCKCGAPAIHHECNACSAFHNTCD